MSDWIREVSPRFKARTIGAFYFLSVAAGVVGEFVLHGGPEYAAGWIAISFQIVMTLVLYDLIKPVDRKLALLATFANLVGLAFEALRWNPRGVDIAMVFHGSFCLLIGYLVFRSAFLPRILGALMAFAGLVWLLYLSPPLAEYLSPWNTVLGLLGEASLMLWLLVMGVNIPRWKEQAGTEAPSIRT